MLAVLSAACAAGVLPDATDVKPRDASPADISRTEEASVDLANALAAAGTHFKGSIGATEVLSTAVPAACPSRDHHSQTKGYRPAVRRILLAAQSSELVRL